MPTKVRIDTETETWTTRARDETDSWDNGDSAGRVSNVTAHFTNAEIHDWAYSGDSLSKEFAEDLPAGTLLYAVVADYESGSTFGRSGGYAQVLDVFLLKSAADELAEVANQEQYSFTHNGKEYHASYVGYFERLQEIAVWEISLGATGKTGATFRRGT